jgi:excinuclease UvrABC helicase subunit UvrB
MDDDKLYQGLVSILKTFKNRPHHLAKYLISNNAFNENFIKKITNVNLIKYSDSILFKDINQMNEYYNSLLEEGKKEEKLKEMSIELSKKLNDLIKEERYEEAIYIRDYMNNNNIPKINF